MLAPDTRRLGCRPDRLPRAAHNADVIESSPVALTVVESGAADGVPLVALHGVGNSHRTFGFVPPLLPAGFRLLRVDLRGHGSSPKTGRYGLDDYVGDVVALLETRSAPALLVGHSLGGIVAWTVARRRPGLVRAALLEDPPLAPGPRPAASLRYFRDLAEIAGRWQDEGATPEDVAALLAELPAGPRAETAGELFAPDGIAARARGLLAMDPGVLLAVADGTTLLGDDATPPGPLPPVRVLAADPACGGVFPVAAAEALLREHPTVAVRRLPGAGHGIHDEIAHRDTWLAELGDLLAGLPEPPASR